MTRNIPRLFSYAALAALGVAALVAVQALAPPWRRIQRERLAEQVSLARVEAARAEEQLTTRQRSLAYRRAGEAVEREVARLADPAVADRLATVDGRLAGIEVELAALFSAPPVTPEEERERSDLHAELVRRSGTPGVEEAEIEELEAQLMALGGQGAPEAREALEQERRALLVEERSQRAPHEDAVAALAAERADLDRAESRLARLEGWRRGVREFQRSDGVVERCTTCHPGMDDLSTTHTGLGPDSPYQGFGCTVCHGGNGRALDTEEAHRRLTLRPWSVGPDYSLEPLIDQLSSPERRERAAAAAALRDLSGQEFGYRYHADAAERAAAVARWRDWWAAAQGYYRPAYPDGLRAHGYDAAGRPEAYAGSGDCLRCHESRQRRHVERWRATKFQSFARLDEVDDPIACLRCHTTGYDDGTGEFVQEGVTCEGCHGPGVGYTAVMEAGGRLQAAGRMDQGEDLLDWVSSEMRTRMEEQNVCVDCHDPFGVKDLAFEHLM